MGEEEDIKGFILRKLVRHRMWLHKHTSIHNLPKGLPDYLRSSKSVKKVIEEMLRKGLLLSKPTNYGLEVSLNIKNLWSLLSPKGDSLCFGF
jgi:hypothetical protein